MSPINPIVTKNNGQTTFDYSGIVYPSKGAGTVVGHSGGLQQTAYNLVTEGINGISNYMGFTEKTPNNVKTIVNQLGTAFESLQFTTVDQWANYFGMTKEQAQTMLFQADQQENNEKLRPNLPALGAADDGITNPYEIAYWLVREDILSAGFGTEKQIGLLTDKEFAGVKNRLDDTRGILPVANEINNTWLDRNKTSQPNGEWRKQTETHQKNMEALYEKYGYWPSSKRKKAAPDKPQSASATSATQQPVKKSKARKIIVDKNQILSLVSAAFSGVLLKKGSKGDDVNKLQAKLQKLEYYKGDIDGDFGAKTDQAVRDFQAAYQKDKNLSESEFPIDGKVGSKTQIAIEAALTKKILGNK